MKTRTLLACAAILVGVAFACSDKNSAGSGSSGVTGSGGSSAATNRGGTASGGSGASGGGGGSGANGGSAGSGLSGGNAGSTESGGSAGSGGFGVSGGGSNTTGTAGAGGEAGGGSCEPTAEAALGLVDAVSVGMVEVLDDSAGVTTVRVDASAGGVAAQAGNPYTYFSLSESSRVDVTDIASLSSKDWDLAFKRDHVRSNSGDSGPGSAGVIEIEGMDFDAVSASDADGLTIAVDEFLNAFDCQPPNNPGAKPPTALSGWYDYDPQSMTLSPAEKVYLVRAANGTSLYKLEFLSYYETVDDPDFGEVTVSARYSVRYAALD